MYNNLFMGQERIVETTNFNQHQKGELHLNRKCDFHDIIYICDGGWSIGQDSSEYLLNQDDIIFLHAGHRHYGTEKLLPGVKTMFIHTNCLQNDLLSDDCSTEYENTIALPTMISCRHNAAVKSLFEDIIFTYWSDLPQKHYKLTSLINLLIYELYITSKQKRDLSDAIVNDILRMIRTTPGKILTLDEISDNLHLSTRSLTEKFKLVTGKTICQYQMELKIHMAYDLIKEYPNKPFKDIAASFGFYDEFHFSKVFKKYYGFSPVKIKQMTP